MRSRKLSLISITILATLIIGTALVLTSRSDTLIAEQVKIEPKPFDLENPDTVTVYVKLSIEDVPVVDQIDPDTVLLEDYIVPTSTWTTESPPEFVAQFDGVAVASRVISIIVHMGIVTPKPWVPIKIPLKITGLLYNETPWQGTGEIKVYIPGNPIPPPPPPPP